MFRHLRIPPPGRFVIAGIAAGVIALTTATLAFAHNTVSASDTHALATDVTLTFKAEAESDTAGITSLRVVLPEGIAPGDVTFVEGPQGWTFAPGTDGFTVGGTPLAPGTDATYKIKIRQLPDAPALAFKTLQTYADGRVDRWIDPPEEDSHDHSDAGMPAPALTLQKAAPGAVVIPPAPTPAPTSAAPNTPATTAPAPSSAPPTVATAPPSPTADRQDTASDEDDFSALPITLGVIAAIVVLGGAGAWWFRRRSSGSTPS